MPISLPLPNGSHLTAFVSGTIVISPSLTLYNVLYIPNFHVNLISVTKLTTNNDCSLNFSSTLCNILQNHSKQMIGTAKLHRGLYVMDSNAFHNSCNSVVSNSFEMWHLRLGHLSNSGMKYMSKQFPVIPCKNNMDPCDSCHLAKLKKLPFPNCFTNTHAPFELLHADLWGPLATNSILGHRYFLTLVDDFSRFTWVIFLKAKSETKQSVINFVALLENQFNTSLKCFRSDNGSEFSTLNSFFLSKGIIHQKSCVETPQQNGVVERKHQHILNVAQAITFHSNIPLNLWTFSIQHAVHLINCIPNPLLNYKSPYEILFKTFPVLIHLKVFGCLCYATTLQAHRTKFDVRARKSIFLGHKDGTKGYILYDLQSHDLFVSRHVIFFENYFPFKSNISQPKPPEPDPPAMTYDIDHTAPPAVDIIPVTSASSVPVPNDSSTPNDSYTPLLDLSSPHPSATSVVPNPSYPHIIDHEPQTSLSPQPFSPPSNNASPKPVPPTRKSTRTKNPPQYLKDFHCNILTTSRTHEALVSHHTTPYTISKNLSYDRCSPSYKSFCCSISSNVEPKTYLQASKHDCWRQAMDSEIKAL